jgi:hypothetical protein
LKLLSVNTGLPKEVSWRGHAISTGIFKRPAGGASFRPLDRISGPHRIAVSVRRNLFAAILAAAVL